MLYLLIVRGRAVSLTDGAEGSLETRFATAGTRFRSHCRCVRYFFLSGSPPPLKAGLEVSPACPGCGIGVTAPLGTSGAGSGGVGAEGGNEAPGCIRDG